MRKGIFVKKHKRVKKNINSSKTLKQREARKQLKLQQIRVCLDKKFAEKRRDSC